jgi:hypothetical protein
MLHAMLLEAAPVRSAVGISILPHTFINKQYNAFTFPPSGGTVLSARLRWPDEGRHAFCSLQISGRTASGDPLQGADNRPQPVGRLFARCRTSPDAGGRPFTGSSRSAAICGRLFAGCKRSADGRGRPFAGCDRSPDACRATFCRVQNIRSRIPAPGKHRIRAFRSPVDTEKIKS